MSYSPVPEVEPGDLWTASQHNQYIKDNFAASVPDIFTTKGDLAAGTGADACERFGVGTDGQTLVADSTQTTGLNWGTPGFLDKRQGGSGTDWSVAGTTNYTPQQSVFMQAGSVQWTGSHEHGEVVVNLPTAYNYKPIGWANCGDSFSENIICNVFSTATNQITVYWRDEAGATRTVVNLYWMVIGE